MRYARFRDFGALFEIFVLHLPHGAGGRTRTPGLLLTRQPLYQLSYTSMVLRTGFEPVSSDYKSEALTD